MSYRYFICKSSATEKYIINVDNVKEKEKTTVSYSVSKKFWWK